MPRYTDEEVEANVVPKIVDAIYPVLRLFAIVLPWDRQAPLCFLR